MIIGKILSAVGKILVGDFSACFNNLRTGIEPYTNSIRLSSIVIGSVVGVMFTTYIMKDLFNALYTAVTGNTLGNIAVISLDVTDDALAVMIGSRVFDFVAAKMIIPAYYYLRYGHSKEMYKALSPKELELIHNNIGEQPGSSLKSTRDIRAEAQHTAEGYTAKQIDDIVVTVLSGTLGLMNGIRNNVLLYRHYADNAKILALDNEWLFLRRGQIQPLCALNDSYVKSLLMEAFNLPELTGRYPIASAMMTSTLILESRRNSLRTSYEELTMMPKESFEHKDSHSVPTDEPKECTLQTETYVDEVIIEVMRKKSTSEKRFFEMKTHATEDSGTQSTTTLCPSMSAAL